MDVALFPDPIKRKGPARNQGAAKNRALVSFIPWPSVRFTGPRLWTRTRQGRVRCKILVRNDDLELPGGTQEECGCGYYTHTKLIITII